MQRPIVIQIATESHPPKTWGLPVPETPLPTATKAGTRFLWPFPYQVRTHAVSLNQRCKRLLIARGVKALQELPVCGVADLGAHGGTLEGSDDAIHRTD